MCGRRAREAGSRRIGGAASANSHPGECSTRVLTASVFISLTTYVMVTKKDFSFLGGGLFAALLILIVWGIMNSIFDFGLGGRMVFSLIGALIFVGYILYDTSLIIHHYGPDDYVIAAVTLYLDIINLFRSGPPTERRTFASCLFLLLLPLL